MTNSTPQEVSYCDIETHEEYLDTAELYREIVSDPKELYIGVLNLLFTLVGSSTNLAIIIFLVKNKNLKDVPTLLFVVLCSTDLLSCTVLGTFQTLISFRAIELTSFIEGSFLSFRLISMVYNVVTRYSLFQFTLMSVSRCMLVRSPFRELNRHAVSCSLVGYLILCLVMFLLPFWMCHDPHLAYKAILLFRIGSVDTADQVSFRDGTVDLKSGILIFAYEVISTCLPLIPTTISCILTGVELMRRKQGDENTPYMAEKRASAVTVILLTSSTVLCFLPRTILILSFLFQETTLADHILDLSETDGWRVIYLMTTGLAIANSCVNPLIFIMRSQNIRWYLRSLLTRAVKPDNSVFSEEIRATNATSIQMTPTVISNFMSANEVSKWKTKTLKTITIC